ncbi:hypothetical protein MMC07_009344 [Pseudocyphellaria aurata]|nr:hypothetical protein [Pseudocyphellaria aurata]
MDYYRIRPEELPSKLYRVDYPDSWVKFIPAIGFQAATLDPNHHSIDSTFESASDLEAFWQSMRDHLDPTSGVRSPFVALFGDETQAKTWALRREVQHQRVCDVVEISGVALSRLSVPTFHPHTLRFRIPDLWNTQGSEYLCLHSVPLLAIVGRSSTSNMLIETVAALQLPGSPPPVPLDQPTSPLPPPDPPLPPTLFVFNRRRIADEDEQEENEEDEAPVENSPEPRRRSSF